MTHGPKNVGFDVHQATTVVVVCTDTDRVIARHIVPTDATAIVSFIRTLRGYVRVAFEEGTQAQWLHDLLRPVVDEVIVCNRRGEAARGTHGDFQDAELLARALQRGTLRPVYHAGERVALQEFARTYRTLTSDATRVMLRLKALFRGRGVGVRGRQVYGRAGRTACLEQLSVPSVRYRARTLYAELDVLQELRPQVKQALLAEARRDPAWRLLRTVPGFGPLRTAQLIASVQTSWRFRTKRPFWAYIGLAVVTRTTAQYGWQDERAVRRSRPPMTRGLNRNHNPVVKGIFKSAALAALRQPGPFREYYERLVTGGTRPALARLSVARKLAAVTLHVWKTGVPYDPAKLSVQA